MQKRIFSLLLALCMTAGITVSVQAAGNNTLPLLPWKPDTNSDTTDNAGNSSGTGTPTVPDTPDTPDTPDVPLSPEVPDEPQQPTEPDEPDEPDENEMATPAITVQRNNIATAPTVHFMNERRRVARIRRSVNFAESSVSWSFA